MFGQYQSTIECLSCNTIKKKVEHFLTLHLNIPRTTFDLKFYFIPYNIMNHPFYFELNGLDLIGDPSNPKSNSISLNIVKRKICSVIKEFYKLTHFDSKRNARIKYPL